MKQIKDETGYRCHKHNFISMESECFECRKEKVFDSNLRYQLKDAIRMVGLPKQSGGWQDHVLDPVVEDLFNRIKILINK